MIVPSLFLALSLFGLRAGDALAEPETGSSIFDGEPSPEMEAIGRKTGDFAKKPRVARTGLPPGVPRAQVFKQDIGGFAAADLDAALNATVGEAYWPLNGSRMSPQDLQDNIAGGRVEQCLIAQSIFERSKYWRWAKAADFTPRCRAGLRDRFPLYCVASEPGQYSGYDKDRKLDADEPQVAGARDFVELLARGGDCAGYARHPDLKYLYFCHETLDPNNHARRGDADKTAKHLIDEILLRCEAEDTVHTEGAGGRRERVVRGVFINDYFCHACSGDGGRMPRQRRPWQD